jgi:hypothetical protein
MILEADEKCHPERGTSRAVSIADGAHEAGPERRLELDRASAQVAGSDANRVSPSRWDRNLAASRPFEAAGDAHR